MRLTAGDGVYREITHFTRDRTEHDVAAHIIMESGISGFRILHRCPIVAVVPAASDLQPG